MDGGKIRENFGHRRREGARTESYGRILKPDFI
jgi:hypothetical protein